MGYVSMIQRREREEAVSTLTHQKWSGSELIDAQISTVTAGMSSTGIMSAGVTETQSLPRSRRPRSYHSCTDLKARHPQYFLPGYIQTVAFKSMRGDRPQE